MTQRNSHRNFVSSLAISAAELRGALLILVLVLISTGGAG
jgi:hypothetical protein